MKKKQLIYIINKKIFLKTLYKYKFSFLFSNLKKINNSNFIIKKTKRWFIHKLNFSIIPFNLRLVCFNNKFLFLDCLKKIKPFFFKYKFYVFTKKLFFLMKKIIIFKKLHIINFFYKVYFSIFFKFKHIFNLIVNHS